MMQRPTLEGVRLEAGVSALSRWRLRRIGAVPYARLAEASAERRQEKRRAVRLNWGKTLDAGDRFLSECLIVDRGGGGVRLRLARVVVLPSRFQLFDDADGLLYAARLVWRRGQEAGCRLARQPTPDKPQVLRRMKGPYYGL
jgi:hypothetical protein